MKPEETEPAFVDESESAFVDESERHRFRYRCEHCAHFARQVQACSMGYPTRGLVGPVVVPPIICKYWELSEDA